MFRRNSPTLPERSDQIEPDLGDPYLETSSDGQDGSSGADQLLSALQYLAKTWQRPDSAVLLTAGLPLEDGKLTADLLPEAAGRIGVSCNKLFKALRDVEAFEFPLIFEHNHSGELLVCLKREGRKLYRCFDPETQSERMVSAKELQHGTDQVFISLLPNHDLTRNSSQYSDSKHWFLNALSGHWRSAFYVLLAATFINTFAIAFSLFVLNVYDRVLPNEAISTLWVLAGGLAVVLLFDLLLKLARASIIDHVGRRIDLRLSAALFDHVLNATMDARPKSTGAFINQITQYEVLREFLASSTLVTFIDALFLGVFAFVIYQIVGWVVLLPIGFGVLGILLSLVASFLSRPLVSNALQESSSRYGLLVETLSSIQTVKASRAEGLFLNKWKQAISASSRTQIRIRRIQAFATNSTNFLTQLSMAGIVIAGTFGFARGEISMGAIVATMMLSNRLTAPISQIASTILRTRAAIEAFGSVSAIMKLRDERENNSQAITRSISSGRVQLNKVRFAYEGTSVHVLDGISLNIEPGEKVGIIGRIGSGKTTLGRLLVNFYEPTEGEILIDGVTIGQYHPAELRAGVGLVLQDPELFAGTVRENIIMSEPMASEERFLKACERAGVEAFVSRHPLGYDMPVGERGQLLSGGQKQAIALARTMLAEPTILFLDEPSSAMDTATERQLINRLEASLKPEQTVLVATHRHSLLSLVTRLVVLDNGRIVADGEKSAVLAQLKSGRGEGA